MRIQYSAIFLISFLSLCGCATPEQKCTQLGYRPGTTDFLNCYNSVAQQQQQAYSNLQQYGNQAQQQQQAQQNALLQDTFGSPKHTTCKPQGNTVRCDSW
ncbi:MAG: hypothetical protein K2Q32_01775 [Alphaproteobacteria bacterium]|nr:hypothetical protein [Alphaproteobacteria bacterium]